MIPVPVCPVDPVVVPVDTAAFGYVGHRFDAGVFVYDPRLGIEGIDDDGATVWCTVACADLRWRFDLEAPLHDQPWDTVDHAATQTFTRAGRRIEVHTQTGQPVAGLAAVYVHTPWLDVLHLGITGDTDFASTLPAYLAAVSRWAEFVATAG